MLDNDKIDINEAIDINKNILISRKCWLCGYWYFIDKFSYQKLTLIIKNICVMVAIICL